ncbi:MAG TPA: GspE/PulE family protein [Planctomycetaceae bacterium]|nr:GspE/PulE family protein [Planctomycetaceae bacterium]
MATTTALAPQSLTPLVPPDSAEDVGRAVDQLLRAATAAQASDVHLRPAADGLHILWRMDGVLQDRGVWPARWMANVVGRLKVLAELLTYKTDLPQEGRLKGGVDGVEMRLSTFPTLHGENAVVRLFVGAGPLRHLDELQLPDDILDSTRRLLSGTSGCVLIVGPAGSGKTTTAYACLRELQRSHGSGKSLVTLEDPIEAEIAGVAQTQVHRPVEFTYAVGLKSLMRQDPDAILVGEIRDRDTAETVFQACLTGHLVLTTFHAGSAAQAVTRLLDLGVEPYLLKSGLRGVLCQRLLRRLCECAVWTDSEPIAFWPEVRKHRQPVGCPDCWQTGYRGRAVIAELLIPDELPGFTTAFDRGPVADREQLAAQAGLSLLWDRAAEAVTAGVTSPAEVVRVLGLPQPKNRATR